MPSEENQKIIIDGQEFEVLDAKEKITIPDCIVSPHNKIGVGHGEAKIYFGQRNGETLRFFDDFSRQCFFLKSDLLRYLEEVKEEYKNPSQPYRNKDDLPEDWDIHWGKANELSDEVLDFNLDFQEHLAGPRLYLNSPAGIYKFMRKISLPNITFLSALKLKDIGGNIIYYFKLFADYFGEVEPTVIIEQEIEEIESDSTIEEDQKKTIVRARVGQGDYRKNLLAECPFCPLTTISDDRLLIASHIKPWAKCDTQEERLDPKNGFMLSPTFDWLFDKGYISFNNDKSIMISPWLSKMTLSKLGIAPGKKYPLLPLGGREEYLEYHRDHVFNK